MTLVNSFFCQRAVSTIFERLARKSVETVRSQKKQLNNDTKNSTLDVAGFPLLLKMDLPHGFVGPLYYLRRGSL